MPSNVRHYDKSCKEVWITDTRVYKCFTCDASKQLIVCENCFRNGKHNDHNYITITSIKGFCNCGDFSGRLSCREHHRVILSDVSKPLHANEWALQEFTGQTGIGEREVTFLSYLNRIRKLYNQSTDGVLIKTYFENSQAEGQRAIRLGTIYSVCRKDHEKRFIDSGYEGQRRLLLWHGTKCANLSGILRHGFKLPTTGNHRFGNGIYFADRVAKSCEYCDQSRPGVLLLCEVSLGSMFTTGKSCSYTSAPENYDSIRGIGKYIPDPSLRQPFDRRIEVPIGRTIERCLDISATDLDFNEYVVYEPQRILIRFIVLFDWS